MSFVMREAKKVLLLQISRDYDKEMLFIFMQTLLYVRGHKGRRRGGESNTEKKIPKFALFGQIFFFT